MSLDFHAASPFVPCRCVGCDKPLIRHKDETEPKCMPCSGISKSRGGLSPVGDGGDQEIFDEQRHENDHAASSRF